MEARGKDCPEKPEKLQGQPCGQYHCPFCGMILITGTPHPEPTEDNPDYTFIDQWPEKVDT